MASAKIETFSLTPQELKFVEDKAKNSTYFASLLEGYTQYKSVTKKQRDAIHNEQKRDKDFANRPKLKDEAGELGPINNKVFRDNKPVCFMRACRDFATVRIDAIGVCADHVEEGKEQNAAHHAQRESAKA